MIDPTQAATISLSLSVVLPVRNRASTIAASLAGLCRVLDERPPADWELLVVDDGSEDATPEQVIGFSRTQPQVLMLRNPAPIGVGYAARHGVLLARGDRILLSTAAPPEPWFALPQMEERLGEGFDLVVASDRIETPRPLPPVRMRAELLRRVVPLRRGGNQGGESTSSLRLQLCRRDPAIEIYSRQRCKGASFGIEVLYLARRYQYRMIGIGIGKQAPAAAEPRRPTGPDVGIGDLLRIRYNRLRGYYG